MARKFDISKVRLNCRTWTNDIEMKPYRAMAEGMRVYAAQARNLGLGDDEIEEDLHAMTAEQHYCGIQVRTFGSLENEMIFIDLI